MNAKKIALELNDIATDLEGNLGECPNCGGSGFDTCHHCMGRGCHMCDGTGEEACHSCSSMQVHEPAVEIPGPGGSGMGGHWGHWSSRKISEELERTAAEMSGESDDAEDAIEEEEKIEEEAEAGDDEFEDSESDTDPDDDAEFEDEEPPMSKEELIDKFQEEFDTLRNTFDELQETMGVSADEEGMEEEGMLGEEFGTTEPEMDIKEGLGEEMPSMESEIGEPEMDEAGNVMEIRHMLDSLQEKLMALTGEGEEEMEEEFSDEEDFGGEEEGFSSDGFEPHGESGGELPEEFRSDEF